MKTILYTGFDAAYKPLAAITIPRMREYAKRHGFDFTCAMAPLIDVPNGIYWTGVCGALEAFKCGYDRAIYLDVDQLITNYDWIPPFSRGFDASRDWGNDATAPHHFSMCGFSAMASCVPMMASVLESEPEWRDKPFPEQGPMQWWVEKLQQELNVNNPIVTIHHRKVFNCVPNQCCPGAVPEPWVTGDFAAHITMVPLERRVEIANEILSKL